ncbi:cytochrome P450 3A11 [Caerostris darwini]|uniref:Cytochrome P450 3A11 n=1 Tax=Caerostris darwini TaxID=1538125 RepID=A0AAV4P6X7_9ARAC|nr:cytochrome P450 3A11 [Caerostris darwini]
MDYINVILLAALTSLICCFYKKLTKDFNFWLKQNVPFVPPDVLVYIPLKKSNKPLQELEVEWYNTYGRVYGRFEAPNPVLCVGEPDILKKILVKDFHIFQNRRDLKFHDPIMDNTLFVLDGDAWKRVRNIVTPAFTTSKLKRIMPLLTECCDLLVERLSETLEKSEFINCQDFFESFVLCAIGRCAFGMNISAVKNPDNTFVEKSKKLFDECLSWRTKLTVLCPALMKVFRLNLLNPETTEFYRDIIIQVLEERKKHNVIKDDFLQMLLDAEDSNNNGNDTVCEKGSCKINTNSKPTNKGLSHDEMLSQSITFFIAGFDVTTSLLSHICYRLAMHQDYQDMVVDEMNEALSNNNGNICYEALAEMKYMDAAINECLRMCPAMARSERRAEADYTVEERNIHLRKGMIVSIPVYAMHHDPQWFPEPEVFKPERFYEPDLNRPQYVHLPFGSGPRICVGMRFVQVQVKMCLTKILMKFQILPAPTTSKTLEFIESRNTMKVGKVEVRLKERCSS